MKLRTDYVLGILKREMIYGLMNLDGCYCGNFTIHGVEAHVSCHKGTMIKHDDLPTIHVWTPDDGGYMFEEELREIAAELITQLRDCHAPSNFYVCLERYSYCESQARQGALAG